jgi:eukaryotic-like serine/threonine-protein kinase
MPGKATNPMNSAQPLPDTLPKKLGKYDVIEAIARGSMGVVYRGYDPFVARPVAIKVALAEALRDKDSGETYRKMFFNEAHTAGMLRHPNILDIFDAGVEGETCYIVMELVEGGDTLKSYIRPDRLLPVQKVLEIVFKCAKALDYAHRNGVIHRDIKPSNMLLTTEQDLKIGDFSIAYVTRRDSSKTIPVGFVGSPRYMSPEQIQEDNVGNQTDLFSLGVVMYEMLTGRHPFGGDSFSKLVYRVVNEEPIPIRQVRPDLPEQIEQIVNRCLQKDLRRRYKMGMDIAVDLSTSFRELDRPMEDISTKEKVASVKRLDFFSGFTEAEIWEIMRASVWERFNAGDEIIVEGEIDDSFYILIDGTVRVKKGEIVVGDLKAGDCFGEMGYISRRRRTATILASAPVTLMRVNSTLMEQVSKDCQLRFCRIFLRILIERLSSTTERMAESPAV